MSVLNFVKLPNGDYRVKGKTVTGFANVEEGFTDNMAWHYGMLPRD
jgi:hypothetical protein